MKFDISCLETPYLIKSVIIITMALRGFSTFEAKFRAKIAKAAPVEVLVARQVVDGLTAEEVQEYKDTFKKFDTDNGGSIDSKELGNLVRVLGFADIFVFAMNIYLFQVKPIR